MKSFPNAKCVGKVTPTRIGSLEVYITAKGKERKGLKYGAS